MALYNNHHDPTALVVVLTVFAKFDAPRAVLNDCTRGMVYLEIRPKQL
jgi:hypothetical protein